MTTVDSVVSSLWKYTKAYPEFVFGTGNEAFANVFKAGVTDKNFKWKNLHHVFGDSFEASIKHNDAQIAKNGGFWKNMWSNLRSFFPDLRKGWTDGGLNKTGFAKYWDKFKGFGKAFGKKMPLVGALLTVAFEIPNIARATWNEGLLSGLAEVGKTGVRLGFGAVGGAIGSLIPIPVVGTIVGYAIGDMIGKFVVGKSYTEKKESEKGQASKDIAQNINNFNIDPTSVPYGGYGAQNDEQFMKLQQAYQQTTGMNYTDGMTNPYQDKLNLIG